MRSALLLHCSASFYTVSGNKARNVFARTKDFAVRKLRALAKGEHGELEKGNGANGAYSSVAPYPDRSTVALEPMTDHKLLEGRFVLPPSEVKSILSTHKLTAEQLLRSLIEPAAELAKPPISNFYVGAVGLGGSGAIYVGVNLEFPGLPLYNSVHAEQFLLTNALHHGERHMECVALSAAPCGHCRQFFSELPNAETLRFFFGNNEKTEFTLPELLPMRFSPQDLLGDDGGPLLLEPQFTALKLIPEAEKLVENRKNDAVFMSAVQTAIREAEKSYVPYSECPAAAVLITKTGQMHGGGCIESVAYNPSLPPIQAALISSVIAGLPSYDQISEVVLVEVQRGLVRHASTTEALLNSISPSAKLTVLKAEKC